MLCLFVRCFWKSAGLQVTWSPVTSAGWSVLLAVSPRVGWSVSCSPFSLGCGLQRPMKAWCVYKSPSLLLCPQHPFYPPDKGRRDHWELLVKKGGVPQSMLLEKSKCNLNAGVPLWWHSFSGSPLTQIFSMFCSTLVLLNGMLGLKQSNQNMAENKLWECVLICLNIRKW